MLKIGIVGFGKVGQNFYALLKDLGLECKVYDGFSTQDFVSHEISSLEKCEVIVICTAKNELKELFSKQLQAFQKQKIRFYTECFYISYWLKESIKDYFGPINEEKFIDLLLKDTPDLKNLSLNLKNAIESIPKEAKNSNFYDDFYLENKHPSFYQESIYYLGWNYALNKLKSFQNDISVLDIGCGEGLFAKMLYEQNIRHYLGIDFSHNAIKKALQNNPYWTDRFIQDDIFTTDKLIQAYSHICIFEVLEHIQDDLDLLGKIPPHTQIIGSVPNFYSQGHIRIFQDIQALKDRYAHLLEFKDFFELPLGSSFSKIFYFHAYKK